MTALIVSMIIIYLKNRKTGRVRTQPVLLKKN